MLHSLTGKVSEVSLDGILIDVQGLGFFVIVPDTFTFSVGETRTLRTHVAVRQDGFELYGFNDPLDLAFFKKCLTVSGVGPKTAMSFLRRSPRENLESAIAKKDATYLTRVVGLGKKAADKLIVELSEKMDKGESHDSADGDVLDTLVALGYTEKEARDALTRVPREIVGKDLRLRAALSQK